MRRIERGLVCSVACGAVTYVAIQGGEWTSGGRLYLASLFSSAVLVATAPTLRQCHPARILTSHIGSMGVGLVARMVVPATPLTIAMSVSVALCLVLVFDALHPPAIANAGIGLVAPESISELLSLVAVTSFLLAGAAVAAAGLASAIPGRSMSLSQFWWRRRR
ncbi:HPP family protein [Sphingopyxis indica]|nr:HPP family protein [Sphingopyxis indica]